MRSKPDDVSGLLEPCAGKLACTVLRGRGGGNATPLPDQAKGAAVHKGETASPIVFYRTVEKADETATDDDDKPDQLFIARGYWVFGAEQVDGYAAAPALPVNPITRIAAADAYFAATGARIVVGGAQACYRPSTDTIHMPDEARFFDGDGRTRSDAFYSVLGHELGILRPVIVQMCSGGNSQSGDLATQLGGVALARCKAILGLARAVEQSKVFGRELPLFCAEPANHGVQFGDLGLKPGDGCAEISRWC